MSFAIPMTEDLTASLRASSFYSDSLNSFGSWWGHRRGSREIKGTHTRITPLTLAESAHIVGVAPPGVTDRDTVSVSECCNMKDTKLVSSTLILDSFNN